MLKIRGLTLTTVLFLGCTACAERRESTVTTTTATPTPAAPTTTPTPTATPADSTTATVKASDFQWRDDASGTPVTTIKLGGKVTWTVVDKASEHQLERVNPSAENGCDQLDASFNSGVLSSGESVSRTFTKVGVFGYRCGIHRGKPNCKNPPGAASGHEMPGVIKVVP